MASGPDVLVVLPAYNESESVAHVIGAIKQSFPTAGVLVVDDGSVDATVAVARSAGAMVVPMPFNTVGGALRAGLIVGHRPGCRAVVQCDADGQHPPAAIRALVDGLADADVVIGARFAGEGEYAARGPRRWAMRLLSVVMTRLHHTRLTDVTSGFRAFGPRAVEVFSSTLPPEYLGDTVEALIIAKEQRLVVRQRPVAMLPRHGGVASQTPWRATRYLTRVMVMLVLSLLRLVGSKIREVSMTFVIGAIAAALVAGTVLVLVTRRRLLVKYATFWLVLSVLLVAASFWPASVSATADILGFEVASNLLFFAGLVLLLLVTLQLSLELSRVEGQVQRLAEEIAILRMHEEHPDVR